MNLIKTQYVVLKNSTGTRPRKQKYFTFQRVSLKTGTMHLI